MKKNAIEVFGEWADLDKDFGMEKNHIAIFNLQLEKKDMNF